MEEIFFFENERIHMMIFFFRNTLSSTTWAAGTGPTTYCLGKSVGPKAIFLAFQLPKCSQSKIQCLHKAAFSETWCIWIKK
jgi:hypothetical protein